MHVLTQTLLTSAALLLSGCGATPPPPEAEGSPPAAAATVAAAPARLLSFRDLLGRERPKADHRIAYGSGPLQFGELWLPPKGRGPLPVLVLIHGGCWRSDLPGLELTDHLAGAFRAEGVAVWNIEYRRIGEQGGGYPTTFKDVAAGVDHLRRLAPAYNLDLNRVVLAGHSAGGHLALWAAARGRTPQASPLRQERPLPVRGVVTLAGINDLAAYRASGPAACGGPETIDALVGAARRRGDVFADTSPAALLPIGVPTTVVSGALDPIVPPRFGRDYAAAAAGRGDRVGERTIPGAGHFELIDPTSPAWAEVRRAVLQRLGA